MDGSSANLPRRCVKQTRKPRSCTAGRPPWILNSRVARSMRASAPLDVFAYHTYPGGYTSNAPSETMDAGAFGQHSTIDLRKAVSSHAGIRPDIQFWDDEYNSLPTLPNDMNELIQAKYVPRAIIYNW